MKFPLWLQIAGCGACLISPATLAARDYWIYFGTFTEGSSQGIYVSRLNSETGTVTPPQLAAHSADPSYLVVAPDHKYLYSVNEYSGQKSGMVSAYLIDAASGRLDLLNQTPSGGVGPCHLSLDVGGQTLLVANYASGSICSFLRQTNGSLGVAVSVVQFQGHSVNPARQAGPHAHFLGVDPSNQFALGCDLGTDRILVYHLDAARAKLTANSPAFTTVPPGAGPRHLVFSRDGRWVYVVDEMACCVSVFKWDGRSGTLLPRQTISALPENTPPTSDCTAAEILLHPNGKFAFVSVRGRDVISVFRLDPVLGGLQRIQTVSSGGRSPRGLGIDPSGRWLFAGNQKSDEVDEFAVDPASGKIRQLDQKLQVGAPVDVKFVGAD